MSQRYAAKNPFSKLEIFTEKSRFYVINRVWQAAANGVWIKGEQIDLLISWFLIISNDFQRFLVISNDF